MRHPGRPDRGFTLVELMVALGIGAFVLAALFECLRRVRMNNDGALAVATAETDSSALIHRIADEVREAGTGSPDWALDAAVPELSYNRCQGWSDGALQWGPARLLATLPLEGPDGAEGDDGADNDSDGLVDERSLVVLDPDTRQVLETWAVNLATPGLALVLQGEDLRVTVTLQACGSRPGDLPAMVSATTVVAPRN